MKLLRSLSIALSLFCVATSANAADSDCNLVFNFKLTAYVQEATDQNIPPGSNIYKDIVSKNKLSTTDLINKIAEAAGEGVPALGTRLALYTGGPNDGRWCLLDPSGQPIPPFNPISDLIMPAIDQTETVTEGTYVDSSTGSGKGKEIMQVVFDWIYGPGTEGTLTGFVDTQFKESYSTGCGTQSVKMTLGGPGTYAGKPAFLRGSATGKGTFCDL